MFLKFFIFIITGALLFPSLNSYAGEVEIIKEFASFHGPNNAPKNAAKDAAFVQLGIDNYINTIESGSVDKIKSSVGKTPMYLAILSAKTIRDQKITITDIENPFIQDLHHDIVAGVKEIKFSLKTVF